MVEDMRQRRIITRSKYETDATKSDVEKEMEGSAEMINTAANAAANKVKNQGDLNKILSYTTVVKPNKN